MTESTVRRYQSALIDEIEPNVSALISKAEQGLSTLEKKESSLQSKVRQVLSHFQEPLH